MRHVERRTAGRSIARTANQEDTDRACRPPTFELLEGRVLFSTFTVTSTLDDGSSGTLRWAVGQANAHAGPDSIAFAAGVSGTVTLSGTPLVLSDTSGKTTISGPGARVLTVSANQLSRVFEINASVDAAIDGLAISDGHAPDGATGGPVNGGGILNVGALTLTNCAVRFNTAGNGRSWPQFQTSQPGGGGGGIFSSGTLTLVNDTLNDNVAGTGGNGMGIHNGGNGGGLYSTGSAQLVNVTVTGNAAGAGGNGGSPMSPGVGGSGGGIYAAGGTMTLADVTVSANHTGRGGLVPSIDRRRYAPNGTGGGLRNNGAAVSLSNTIVARNVTATGGADDIAGAVGGASNLIGIDVGMTGITNGKKGNRIGAPGSAIDSRLMPLGNYGGPTDTMPPLPDSPALGAGDPSLLPRDTLDLDGDGNTTEPLPVDQRGLPRVVGGRLNIGSCQ